ncbi:MAG: ParA family protein, partial [Firmicutes bacterium]|nr:ParA family protein [Bacillota bacterium]
MFTVYVVAKEPLQSGIVTALRNLEGAVLQGSGNNLRVALAECHRDAPGILLLDDSILRDNLGLIDQLAAAVFPIVTIADPSDSEAMRRSLMVRAVDFLPMRQWQGLLNNAVKKNARTSQKRLDAPGTVISVFSSKGGVGKTTIAVNLALALAQVTQKSVALVDLDLQFGDVSPMVGDA